MKSTAEPIADHLEAAQQEQEERRLLSEKERLEQEEQRLLLEKESAERALRELKTKEQLLRRQIAEEQSQHESSSKRKVGRNDPCPCGSGKKYKKCCLKKHDDEHLLN